MSKIIQLKDGNENMYPTTKLLDLIIFREYQSSPVYMPKNTPMDVSVLFDTVDGYTPVACIGFRNNSSNGIFVSQSGRILPIPSTGVGAWCFNTTETDYSNVIIYAMIMYFKDV